MIGVFDFGSGGLTVMRAFESVLHKESFVYLGDHGNAPYGNTSSDDIYHLTRASLTHLYNYGCSLAVIACNTAVAIGLRRLQQTWLPKEYPDRRLLGIITPIAEQITCSPRSSRSVTTYAYTDRAIKRVAIFATQHTVQSNAFAMEINSRNCGIKVHQQACPGLALLIEQAAPENILRAEIRKYVNAALSFIAEPPDLCILGCTHYSIVEHIWQTELPNSSPIISQPNVCAQSLVEYLKKNPQFSTAKTGENKFFTTGNIETVSERASLFYNKKVEFSRLDG